mmetsp:Transcript_29575/g.69651  ORF Transcript_29575/g.69651 Transcript_29575/m.69651 type:complete len:273 (-) Transcript_29575:19-837(-)
MRLDEHHHLRRAARLQRPRDDLLQLGEEVAPVELRVALVERVAQPLLLEQEVADSRASVLVHVAVDEDGALLGAGGLVGGQRRARLVPAHGQLRQAALRRPRQPQPFRARSAPNVLRVRRRVAPLRLPPPGRPVPVDVGQRPPPPSPSASPRQSIAEVAARLCPASEATVRAAASGAEAAPPTPGHLAGRRGRPAVPADPAPLAVERHRVVPLLLAREQPARIAEGRGVGVNGGVHLGQAAAIGGIAGIGRRPRRREHRDGDPHRQCHLRLP